MPTSAIAARAKTETPDVTAQGKHRDFLHLLIYVATQHHLYERAYTIVQALIAEGDESADVYLAEAVLLFYLEDFERALETLRHLERIDPVERFGDRKLAKKYRMRGFLKARCLHELKSDDSDEERSALELYLRHTNKLD